MVGKVTPNTQESASIIAAIMGHDPYKTPNECLRSCINANAGIPAKDWVQSKQAAFGDRIEPFLAESACKALSGSKLKTDYDEAFHHKELPLACSLDATCFADTTIEHDPDNGIFVMTPERKIKLYGTGVIECKNTSVRPFFLYLAHWAPHTPLQATREDYEALSDIELHRERVYAAMIRSLDRSVGRVMDALKSNGLDENTLVIFTSDNGGAGYIGLPDVNDPYRGWKGSFFEGGIRVPFLARWPARLPSGSTYTAPVHHFDIYTTAAATAGADLPTDRPIDGVDLMPYLINTDLTDTPHEHLFFRSGAAQAVRDERWKLVVSAPQGLPRKEWLFDLTSDGEWNNLLAEQPEVANRLRDALEAHNSEQTEPLWPSIATTARNIDRDLSQQDQPGDEFAYWSN